MPNKQCANTFNRIEGVSLTYAHSKHRHKPVISCLAAMWLMKEDRGLQKGPKEIALLLGAQVKCKGTSRVDLLSTVSVAAKWQALILPFLPFRSKPLTSLHPAVPKLLCRIFWGPICKNTVGCGCVHTVV